MQFRRLVLLICLLPTMAGTFSLLATEVEAGLYLNSAHGNAATYGVLRLAGYSRANCAHCHEQHASIGGSEPAPTGTVMEYLLFDGDNNGQQTNFCFSCHAATSSYQQVSNRSYSFRAGSWLGDPLSNVQTAFGPTQASSHNLADIVVLANNNWPVKYPLTTNSCAVCHDPHLVKGDPPNNSGSAKTSATRPGVITEINSSPVKLWGAVAGEMINPNFTNNYQAPFRVGAASYEPDGTVQTGTNLPDYVNFCTKCHTDTDAAINSSDLGRNLKIISWYGAALNPEKHGKLNADGAIQVNLPYTAGAAPVPGYDLSCLDCHEPHGSVSQSTLRGEVNGVVTGQTLNGVIVGGGFDYFCDKCHNPQNGVAVRWDDEHHALGVVADAPYAQGATCNTFPGCHAQVAAPVTQIVCSNCHYHGARTGQPLGGGGGNIPAVNQGTLGPRTLF